ncbi:two-component system histidine kinase PnpS [Thermoanaerobacterium sp. RBIITD]|uniref:two-component system histidine kinase PnpS n=1 Tax=Thermoanaerobacterium sp. RBIITD TaxID=1550240 RepID=UPI000BB9315B|nr:ATP-binding protein [Thermoanaerobacterium sp. RBIITD]SNX52775.1 two-component system, OmpR family, phosphate regulon sensor histidine kinase PhoR [Thermoanaerobacterium sp. RBIITD]
MLKKLYYSYFLLSFLGVLISSVFFIGYVSNLRFLLAILHGLLISNIFGYRFVKSIVSPINEITDVAKEITKGNYEHRIEIKSIDEIGQLSSAINIMSERLRETIDELYDRNAKLEAILKSIINGVIAFDDNEKILLINDSARAILDIKENDIIGKHILDVVRNTKFHDILENIIKNKEYTIKNLELNTYNKSLKIYSSPIIHQVTQKKLGFVVIINDITEVRKLEKIRSDFVANVSHELRTPLTSIRGFVETLREGAIDNVQARDKFLEIIEFETERLTRLINDILTLSEIENLKEGFATENIIIDKEIEEIFYIMEKSANDKKIKLIKDLNCDGLKINTNRDRLRQMIINLIDNGIKYTQEGGYVKVSTIDSYDEIIITVEDSGIGISKENIPRLFERFYRIDKGRSRKLGGTGLGLAIVKHIVESMKGNITVESEVGRGTKFTINLPKS